jgi:hypothetical protein
MYGGGRSWSSDSGEGLCAGDVSVLEMSDIGNSASSSRESETMLGASSAGAAAVMTCPGGAPAKMTNPP